MPGIMLKNVAAGTANAVAGLKFEEIPAEGALITLYATAAVAGGLVSLSVGTEDFLVNAEVNVEEAADVINTNRDLVLNAEPVPPGKLFVGVDDQICNVLIIQE